MIGRWTIVLSVWGIVALGGCQRTVLQSPLNPDHDPADQTAQLEFWRGLAQRPLTTNNEAFHALLIFVNDQDVQRDYAGRVNWLKANGYLGQGFDQPADAAVERGTVARILGKSMNLRGGLTYSLVGPHPRYALRELVYLNIMPPSSEQQGLSGIEFLAIMSKAESHMEDEE